MLSRTLVLAGLICAVGVADAGAQQAYGPGFGVSGPLMASGTPVTATYYGWEATTYYGHEVYALTGDQYSTDLSDGCFAFYLQYRANCAGPSSTDLGDLLGLALFGKPFGVTCNVADPLIDPCLASPYSVSFGWTPNTEIIFALQVNQGNGEYNWFFSGNPTRNNDGLAHIAYFPSGTYPGGVPGDRGDGLVPGTAGASLYGFEDVTYHDSDWDFNNSLFAVESGVIGGPTSVVPEPATLGLVASGLIGLNALGLRRRRKIHRA